MQVQRGHLGLDYLGLILEQLDYRCLLGTHPFHLQCRFLVQPVLLLVDLQQLVDHLQMQEGKMKLEMVCLYWCQVQVVWFP